MGDMRYLGFFPFFLRNQIRSNKTKLTPNKRRVRCIVEFGGAVDAGAENTPIKVERIKFYLHLRKLPETENFITVIRRIKVTLVIY